LTNGRLARGLRRCSAWAIIPLPVPVSPVISTVVLPAGATRSTSSITSRIAGLSPSTVPPRRVRAAQRAHLAPQRRQLQERRDRGVEPLEARTASPGSPARPSQRLHGRAHRGVRRHHHRGRVGLLLQLAQDLGALAVGELDVEQGEVRVDAVDDGARLGDRQPAPMTSCRPRSSRSARAGAQEASSSSRTRMRASAIAPPAPCAWPRLPPRAAPTRTVVPRPGSNRCTAPSCAATIRADQRQPQPGAGRLGRVEGPQHLLDRLGGMPTPVSSTSTTTRPGRPRSRTVSVPPFGIASAAFSIRFSATCSSRCASPWTGPSRLRTRAASRRRGAAGCAESCISAPSSTCACRPARAHAPPVGRARRGRASSRSACPAAAHRTHHLLAARVERVLLVHQLQRRRIEASGRLNSCAISAAISPTCASPACASICCAALRASSLGRALLLDQRGDGSREPADLVGPGARPSAVEQPRDRRTGCDDLALEHGEEQRAMASTEAATRPTPSGGRGPSRRGAGRRGSRPGAPCCPAPPAAGTPRPPRCRRRIARSRRRAAPRGAGSSGCGRAGPPPRRSRRAAPLPSGAKTRACSMTPLSTSCRRLRRAWSGCPAISAASTGPRTAPAASSACCSATVSASCFQ
jgi:hypothetical protein